MFFSTLLRARQACGGSMGRSGRVAGLLRSARRRVIAASLGLALVAAACSSGDTGTPTAILPPPTAPPSGGPDFRITTTAFAAGQPIPDRYTCEGPDVSPELWWTAPFWPNGGPMAEVRASSTGPTASPWICRGTSTWQMPAITASRNLGCPSKNDAGITPHQKGSLLDR